MQPTKSHRQQQNQQALMAIAPEKTTLELPDGWVDWYPNFLDFETADNLLAHLTENRENLAWPYLKLQGGLVPEQGFFNNIPWQQHKVLVYGKWHHTPRLTAWQSSGNQAYKYAGLLHNPDPMTPPVQTIQQKIAETTGFACNSVLLNWYRSGADAMGYHADNEPELGNNPVIASLSLGATRKFVLKHNTIKISQTFPLQHGSLLVMRGALQHHWKHALPKALRVAEGRINLTFRQIHTR